MEAINEFMRRNPRVEKAGGGMLVQPSADGSRPGYKQKIEIEKPLMTEEKQKRSMTPLRDDYRGKIKGNVKGIDNKPIFKKIYDQNLYDAIEVRNAIVKNKGFISSLEELGDKADILLGTTKPGERARPDTRKVRTALALAMDTFPELKNFQLSSTKYGFEMRKVRKLDMMYKTIIASMNKGEDGLAQFLPENMGMFYERRFTGKPERAIFTKIYGFNEKEIKYITDRVSSELGQTFTKKDYTALLNNVKNYRKEVKSNKAQYTRALEMNEDIKKLYDDEIIQSLIKNKNLTKEIQSQILERAVEVIGDDISVASKRLFMMGEAMSGTRSIDGIKINKDLSKKIIDTQRIIGKSGNGYAFAGQLYQHYGRVIDQALGSEFGKSFLGYYQTRIKNALDQGIVPDEIFSVTASGRRGLEPYAIFTQGLRADINSIIKGARIDSALSKTHANLQEIFQGRKFNELDRLEKKAALDLVKDFEKTKELALKSPLNPSEVKKGAKPIYLTKEQIEKLQLPEFDLKNPPAKSIENFDKRFLKYPNLKKAFETSFENVGYSMKVPASMYTQKEALDNISDFFCDRVVKAEGGRLGFANGTCPISEKKKNLVNYSKRVVAGDVTPETAERIAKEVAKVTAKVGSKSALATFLGPAGIGLDIVYEVGSIGFDMAYGTPFKRALENNWITGAFTKTTGEEAYNKDLFAKFPQAQPYGKLGEIINRITKIQNTLSTIEGDPASEYNNPERIQALQTELNNLENEYTTLSRDGKALEEGSNEQIAYNQAKQEFDSIEAAKAPIKPMSEAGFEQMIKEGAQDRPVLGKMDIEMIPNVTAFTKKELDDVLFNVGQKYGYQSTPSPYSFGLGEITVGPQIGKYSENLGYQQLADILQQDLDTAKTDEIARAGGVANLAGGGIAKIAGVDSGPPPESGPMSQGLQGLMKRGIKG